MMSRIGLAAVMSSVMVVLLAGRVGGESATTYEATIGSQFEVSASQANLTAFAKKPTVYVTGGTSLVGKKKSATVLTKSYPAAAGEADPAVGVHTVEVDAAVAVTALPADGYAFTGWTAEGGASVADPNAETTTG